MHLTMTRVIATSLLSAAAALPLASTANAETWPSRAITYVLPSAAGGSPDVLSRIVTAQLSEQLGVSVVVENKPGAAGSIGMSQLKRSAADGYTIGYGNINTLAVNQSLFKELSYDVDADFVPVAHLFNLYNVLIVPAGSELKSMDDLIKKAEANPGSMSYGASGVGTTGHMGGELFKSLAKIDVEFIPYTGGPGALQDLLGERLDYMFINSSEAAPLIESGKVRALGVSSLKRIALLPDVPTIDELGVKGYETVAWGGIVAPKDTPEPIISKLNAELRKTLEEPAVQERLAGLGAEPAGGSPADFQKLIDAETAKWRDIIATAGIPQL